MGKIKGSIRRRDEQGNEHEDFLFTYSEKEREQNEINRDNAKLVFSPKFIPFYPKLLGFGLSVTECLVFGFIDFYVSSGNRFYFTNEQIAKIVGCSENTASTAISKIEKLGFIRTNRKRKAGGGQVRFIKNPKSDFGNLGVGTLEKHGTNKNKINKNNINTGAKAPVSIFMNINELNDSDVSYEEEGVKKETFGKYPAIIAKYYCELLGKRSASPHLKAAKELMIIASEEYPNDTLEERCDQIKMRIKFAQKFYKKMNIKDWNLIKVADKWDILLEEFKTGKY